MRLIYSAWEKFSENRKNHSEKGKRKRSLCVHRYLFAFQRRRCNFRKFSAMGFPNPIFEFPMIACAYVRTYTQRHLNMDTRGSIKSALYISPALLHPSDLGERASVLCETPDLITGSLFLQICFFLFFLFFSSTTTSERDAELKVFPRYARVIVRIRALVRATTSDANDASAS